MNLIGVIYSINHDLTVGWISGHVEAYKDQVCPVFVATSDGWT